MSPLQKLGMALQLHGSSRPVPGEEVALEPDRLGAFANSFLPNSWQAGAAQRHSMHDCSLPPGQESSLPLMRRAPESLPETTTNSGISMSKPRDAGVSGVLGASQHPLPLDLSVGSLQMDPSCANMGSFSAGTGISVGSFSLGARMAAPIPLLPSGGNSLLRGCENYPQSFTVGKLPMQMPPASVGYAIENRSPSPMPLASGSSSNILYGTPAVGSYAASPHPTASFGGCTARFQTAAPAAVPIGIPTHSPPSPLLQQRSWSPAPSRSRSASPRPASQVWTGPPQLLTGVSVSWVPGPPPPPVPLTLSSSGTSTAVGSAQVLSPGPAFRPSFAWGTSAQETMQVLTSASAGVAVTAGSTARHVSQRLEAVSPDHKGNLQCMPAKYSRQRWDSEFPVATDAPEVPRVGLAASAASSRGRGCLCHATLVAEAKNGLEQRVAAAVSEKRRWMNETAPAAASASPMQRSSYPIESSFYDELTTLDMNLRERHSEFEVPAPRGAFSSSSTHLSELLSTSTNDKFLLGKLTPPFLKYLSESSPPGRDLASGATSSLDSLRQSGTASLLSSGSFLLHRPIQLPASRLQDIQLQSSRLQGLRGLPTEGSSSRLASSHSSLLGSSRFGQTDQPSRSRFGETPSPSAFQRIKARSASPTWEERDRPRPSALFGSTVDRPSSSSSSASATGQLSQIFESRLRGAPPPEPLQPSRLFAHCGEPHEAANLRLRNENAAQGSFTLLPHRDSPQDPTFPAHGNYQFSPLSPRLWAQELSTSTENAFANGEPQQYSQTQDQPFQQQEQQQQQRQQEQLQQQQLQQQLQQQQQELQQQQQEQQGSAQSRRSRSPRSPAPEGHRLTTSSEERLASRSPRSDSENWAPKPLPWLREESSEESRGLIRRPSEREPSGSGSKGRKNQRPSGALGAELIQRKEGAGDDGTFVSLALDTGPKAAQEGYQVLGWWEARGSGDAAGGVSQLTPSPLMFDTAAHGIALDTMLASSSDTTFHFRNLDKLASKHV
ncbi:unnamed protein product [Polarella glacialis]|uniref:Uncharacterized protein n=1 Tax=Polarella glacialis TaxID=89957 RepID=A0A813HYR1_POLGL|nr:unnamed protein product [Polarella glacialis]